MTKLSILAANRSVSLAVSHTRRTQTWDMTSVESFACTYVRGSRRAQLNFNVRPKNSSAHAYYGQMEPNKILFVDLAGREPDETKELRNNK